MRRQYHRDDDGGEDGDRDEAQRFLQPFGQHDAVAQNEYQGLDRHGDDDHARDHQGAVHPASRANRSRERLKAMPVATPISTAESKPNL